MMNKLRKFMTFMTLSAVCLSACANGQDNFDNALACVADGWTAGDAKAASECFTEDAFYTESGQRQLYEGRQALYEFFGGAEGRESTMSMTWHGRAFDPAAQTGLAEFTFEYGTYAHGVAIIQLKGDKIAEWREYWYESEQDWADFIAPRKPITEIQE